MITPADVVLQATGNTAGRRRAVKRSLLVTAILGEPSRPIHSTAGYVHESGFLPLPTPPSGAAALFVAHGSRTMSPAAIAAQPVNEKEGSPFDTGMQAIEWVRAHMRLCTLLPRDVQRALRPTLTSHYQCIASQATAQVLSLPQLIPYSDEVISAARGVWTLDQNTGLSGHDDDDGGGNWQSSHKHSGRR